MPSRTHDSIPFLREVPSHFCLVVVKEVCVRDHDDGEP